MNPLVALTLNLLLPIIPWVSLSAWWVAKQWQSRYIWYLMAGGILLDLWWAKPIGATSLLLISLTILIKFLSRVWPTDPRFLWPLTFIFSLAIFEVYLALT